MEKQEKYNKINNKKYFKCNLCQVLICVICGR